MIKIIAPFSAIPSWEGFEYQGHTALFVALTHMWTEIEQGNVADITLYQLGMEGEEDFSIIKDGNYISLHQVKAGAPNLNDVDKACFILSILQYNAGASFFHVIPSATISSNFVAKTTQHIDILTNELDKEVITIAEIIALLGARHNKEIKKNDKEYKKVESKYIIVDYIKSTASKGSIYKILDFTCGSNKSKHQVMDTVNDLKSDLLAYKKSLSNKADTDFWNIYNPQFDTSSEVIKASCKIIEKILEKSNPNGCIYYNEIYYQFIYDLLVNHLKKIISAHNTKTEKNSCKIEFDDLLKLILKDHKAASNTTEYQYYELLQSIEDVFKQYPTSPRTDCTYTDCNRCPDAKTCNLYKQITNILALNYENRKDFLYKLLLRTPKNTLPQNAAIRNLMIVLLKKTQLACYSDSNTILAEEGGHIYRLSLDENEFIEDFITQLNEEFTSKDAYKLLLYESDILITDRLNYDNFAYNQINFNVMGAKELDELKDITTDSISRQSKNYNKAKVIKIIDKNIAEKELKQ